MNINEIKPTKNIEFKLINALSEREPELSFFFPEDSNFSFPIVKKTGSVTVIQEKSGKNTYFVSLGERKKASSAVFRKAAAAFSRWCASKSDVIVELDLDQPVFGESSEVRNAVLEGLCIGGYQPYRHKKRENKISHVLQVNIKTTASGTSTDAIKKAEIVGEAVDLAKDWIREPANIINPEVLEARAKTLADAYGFSFSSIQYDELIKMGAGGITAVGKGSQTKPRLIVLNYNGNGSAAPIVLVGKAVTFDTGGYSLKGVEFIQGMKYDKAGGISVMSVVMAAARLKLKVNLVGIVPTVENMISGEAYRPDDILTLLSGQTVEIVSTDAEGRLILADALSYAQSEFKPKAIIDIATLTGGVKIALGKERAGLLSNSDDLAEIIFSAGEEIDEKVWRLPLDEEYFDLIKSDDADMKNSGPREAHTIIGAMFLKQAVADEVQWAHLDIAATGSSENETPWAGKGPNGFGVRLMLRTVEKLINLK